MDNPFDNLVQVFAVTDVAIHEAFLHGLLTGCATLPKYCLKSLQQEVCSAGALTKTAQEALVDAVDYLSDQLAGFTFEAHYDAGQLAEGRRWIEGYLKAMELHRTVAKELCVSLPKPAALIENPDLMTHTAVAIYHDFRCGCYEIDSDDVAAFPVFSREELNLTDEEGLLHLLILFEDEIPMNLIEECAARGEAMVPWLQRHLEASENWNECISVGDWWALLHAIFILGLIPGKSSAVALIDGYRRLMANELSKLCDWTAGNWPALCKNKTEFTTPLFKQIADDTKLSNTARTQAIECVLAAASQSDSIELEHTIDWLANKCADTSETMEFRVIAGHGLLDYPRERWRTLMEQLVSIQKPGSLIENAYGLSEIQRAFDVGDNPEWRNFDNPWMFYEPEEIRRRYNQRSREDLALMNPAFAAAAENTKVLLE